MKSILVPVDLSPAATKVCRVACDLARRLGGKLRLIHVVQPPVIVSDLYAVEAPYVGEMLAAAEAAAKSRLLRLARMCERKGQKVKIECPVGGAITQLMPWVRTADLVVIGSHGHGAMYDLFVGSTTLGILKRAKCPVLVVPIRPNRV